MDTWLLILLIALGTLIVVFGVGGAIAVNRRNRSQAQGFDERLSVINRELAAAHAQDNGWDPAALLTIARERFGAAHPDVEVSDVKLTQVIDPPGTDDDRAIFSISTSGGDVIFELGRRDGEWVVAQQ